MRGVRRLALGLVVFGLVALVLFFVLENQQLVTLVLFGWTAPALPVAVLVLAAGFLGLLVGPLLGACVVLRSGRRSRTCD